MSYPKALNDYLIVKEEAPPDTTATGIHLPQLRRSVQREGVVVSTGPGRYLPDGSFIPLQVKVGDRVTYDGLNGVVIRKNGEFWFVSVSEKHVLAIVDEGV